MDKRMTFSERGIGYNQYVKEAGIRTANKK